jgi:hypothetical protein
MDKQSYLKGHPLLFVGLHCRIGLQQRFFMALFGNLALLCRGQSRGPEDAFRRARSLPPSPDSCPAGGGNPWPVRGARVRRDAHYRLPWSSRRRRARIGRSSSRWGQAEEGVVWAPGLQQVAPCRCGAPLGRAGTCPCPCRDAPAPARAGKMAAECGCGSSFSRGAGAARGRVLHGFRCTEASAL